MIEWEAMVANLIVAAIGLFPSCFYSFCVPTMIEWEAMVANLIVVTIGLFP